MIDPFTAAAVLAVIADKLLDAVIGLGAEKVADAAGAKLKGDKVKIAFKQALGEAIQRYATSGSRSTLAKPLLDKKGPLAEKTVADELAQLLRFERAPDYRLIGDHWKAALENPPQWRDFTSEAKLLAGFLEEELKASEVLGPVMERRSLEAINEQASLAAGALSNLEEELNNLQSLLSGKIGDLMRAVSGAEYDIQGQVMDFTWYIEEKSRDFVGRRFLFDRLDAFIQANPRGYLTIQGDPGIGKSSLAAEMVKRYGYIHHFNIRPLGVNRTDAFLKNICAQLIAAYQLDYAFLPAAAALDGEFLRKLLNEVSRRLKAGQKAVIVVDALDEVEEAGAAAEGNLLFLPLSLPKGIYFVLTARRTDLRVRMDCEQEQVIVEQDSRPNLEDIRDYVECKASQAGIQAYIAAQAIDRGVFVNYLVEKSQGNFMYLRYVLPEIEHGSYSDLSLASLPAGLKSYYEDHWRRMRGISEEAWLDYKLPVMIALSIVKEPVSIDLLAEFSKVSDRRRIISVLREWQQFLYERKVEYQGAMQKRYRVYHDSFREFIAGKDEVEGEHVSLKKAHGIIADSLWEELFGPAGRGQ